jgi:hypothetical protein
MDNPMKPVLVASLTIVLAIATPILSAQNQQPNGTGAGNAVVAEGKILWQYNTHG